MATTRTTQTLQLWLAMGGLFALVCLLGWSLVVGSRVSDDPLWRPIPVRLYALEEADSTRQAVSTGGTTILLGGDRAPVTRAEMRFILPAYSEDSPHWVVWMRRVPSQSVKISAGDRLISDELKFLAPSITDGPLPGAYIFRLPNEWQGEVSLTLEVQGLRSAALQPVVIPEPLAAHWTQRGTIISVTAYASLFTLAILAFALLFASRDWSFLSFFSFVAACALFIASYNGHLYVIDTFGVFRWLGAGWLYAVSLLLFAATFRILIRYADLEQARPEIADGMRAGVFILLALAAITMFWGSEIARLSGWLLPLIWSICAVVTIAVLFDAWRRRVTQALAVTISLIVAVGALLAYELGAHGKIENAFWTYYGYQIAIVVTALLLGAGLINRLSKYREERDREQRARADSERRMYREAVRSELMTALQMGLRSVEPDEMLPTAFKLLLEHVRRIVPTTSAAIIARGYHGQDILIAHPNAYPVEGEADAIQRMQVLRQQMGGAIEVQKPVTKHDESVPVAIEAVIALPVRAPAWGLLVLERAGATVFHPEELNIARELARLAFVQADETIAASQLRRTAEIDGLTGLLNRRSLDQALLRSTQTAQKNKQQLSVLFVDIDYFKTVNDRLGHACGDHCLRELANMLKGLLAEEDTFGRYGGEEFLVILPGRSSEMARETAEQIRTAVSGNEIRWQNYAFRLTVSIGVGTHYEHETQFGPMVERADKALYAAKRTGRNRVQVAAAEFKPG